MIIVRKPGSMYSPPVQTQGGGGGGKTLLQQSDFTYLGYYAVDLGNDFGYGMGLTHRYVNGQLQFIVLGHQNYAYGFQEPIYILSPPANFGGTINSYIAKIDDWAGGLFGGGRDHYGLWWNPDTQAVWATANVDYPGQVDQGTLLMTVTTLNSNNTVNTVRGLFGLQNTTCRKFMGGFTKIPAWFQSQYGVAPYGIGFGGYSSSMDNGPISLGPVLFSIPDPTVYSDNSDIPSSAWKCLMDHPYLAGAWYPANPAPVSHDHGIRLNNNDITVNLIHVVGQPDWSMPAPDGNYRWMWNDSANQNGVWIDGVNKQGFLMCLSVNLGTIDYT